MFVLNPLNTITEVSKLVVFTKGMVTLRNGFKAVTNITFVIDSII